MIIHFIVEENLVASEYGMGAALLASHLCLQMAYLPITQKHLLDLEKNQHVSKSGKLQPNGLLWNSRINNLDACLVDDLDEGVSEVVVLGDTGTAFNIKSLRKKMAVHSLIIKYYKVMKKQDKFVVLNSVGDVLFRFLKDNFGRPVMTKEHQHLGYDLSIALISTIEKQWDIYPANIAALGDAADALGISLSIDCIPILGVPLEKYDGIVLPGGCDMHDVALEIYYAKYAIRNKIPILGLCLGMQSMVTALLQDVSEKRDIAMAEENPQAASFSFIPLGMHRLGLKKTAYEQNMLFNHRYYLNPEFHKILEDLHVKLLVSRDSPEIVDEILWEEHPFYSGYQGHPELMSSSLHSMCCFENFLHACLDINH